MDVAESTAMHPIESHQLNRRTAIGRLVFTGAAAALLAPGHATAQEATPAAGQCVATASPTQDGIGLASLLVGGIVQDMPAGPVEVRVTRFTLEPGASVPPGSTPYPRLMVIETGNRPVQANPARSCTAPMAQ